MDKSKFYISSILAISSAICAGIGTKNWLIGIAVFLGIAAINEWAYNEPK